MKVKIAFILFMLLGTGTLATFLISDILYKFEIISTPIFDLSFATALFGMCIAISALILVLKLYERPEFKAILEEELK